MCYGSTVVAPLTPSRSRTMSGYLQGGGSLATGACGGKNAGAAGECIISPRAEESMVPMSKKSRPRSMLLPTGLAKWLQSMNCVCIYGVNPGHTPGDVGIMDMPY